jgi:hypothetical protein
MNPLWVIVPAIVGLIAIVQVAQHCKAGYPALKLGTVMLLAGCLDEEAYHQFDSRPR